MFQDVNEISFNCFDLEIYSGGNELSYLLIYLYDVNEIFDILNIKHKNLVNLSKRIQDGYKLNPYHCKLHGFDVT